MKLPNWFKVLWWALLSAAVTVFLAYRHSALMAGDASPVDIVAFLVWTALLLAPVFGKIGLFGLSLEQEIRKVRDEIRSEILLLRTDLHNAVDVRNTFSPQLTLPSPPPDSQLQDMQSKVKEAMKDVLADLGLPQPSQAPTEPNVPGDVGYLFAVRYGIERELRRLANEHQLDFNGRRVAGMQLLRGLVKAGVLDPALHQSIRDLYAVSSAGIHGEDVTQAQVGFVKDVGPELIGVLKEIGDDAD